jgi:GT2 family glycosyltransferase
MFSFSIVIVTYGRRTELEDLLDSIVVQSSISELRQIVIVDNHLKRLGREVVENYADRLMIDYIENDVNSLTSGRSIGAKATNSNVVIFLDDDVILSKDYLENIVEFYKEYPSATGMQGIFHVGDYSKLKNVFNRIFWLFHYSKDNYAVYPSIQASYAGNITDVTVCQWFSGTNFSYKRNVLSEIPFDLNLVKYCEGEDIDYSFRVHQTFGGLYMNPRCRVEHQAAVTSRAIGLEFAMMQEIYGIYLLNKLFPGSMISKFKYFVSRIGKLILFIIEVVRFRPYAITNLMDYISALKKSVFKHNIHDFNKEITK